MKKLLLIFAIVGVLTPAIRAQHQYWEWIDTLNVTDVTTTYLDVQPLSQDRPKAIGGCAWSVTVDAENLDADDATFTIGGSNQYISNGYVYYKFQSFTSQYLPYTLDKDTMADTTKHAGRDIDTTYIQSFSDENYYFTYPMYRFTKGSCTSGYIVVTFRFYVN